MGQTHEQRPRCYVILGATGGIGSALCRRLAGQGARLAVAARTPEKVQALAEELGAQPLALDARRPAEVQACLEQAAAALGQVDGAVNCVGSMILKSAHATSPEEWDETLAVNLTSAFGLVRAAGRVMTNGGGAVVLMSSVAARIGLANHEAIAAAKAGVIGLTISAAATLAGRGVRVNCLAPGLVQTPMTRRLTEHEAARKLSVAMHPLGRLGEPEDIASAIEWLLSPAQRWVTGQVISIDGGMATVQPRPSV